MSETPSVTNPNHAIITVARFDTHYPKDSPDSFVVGITVQCKTNDHSKYMDVIIPYQDAMGKDPVKMAWEKLSGDFQVWLEKVYSINHILGSIFTP